jgi:competence protein ComEC
MASQLQMFDLRKIPVVKVLIPFATGALFGSLSGIPFKDAGIVMAGLLGWGGLLALHGIMRRPSGFLSRLFCCWTFLLCFAAGMAGGWISRPMDPKLPQEERVIIRGQVKEAASHGKGSFSCEVALQSLYASDGVYLCHTLLQVYIDPSIDSVFPAAGEIWQWPGKLYPIRNSGNPGSPDFEAIMHRKHCWYRFYPDRSCAGLPAAARIEASGTLSVSGHVRQLISSKWQGREEDVALLKAVCLGDRRALTQEMRQAFGTAGGMHLLAVSGLHVGLIWWVLQRLTRWMVRKERTEGYRTLAVLGMLWFYACLTGFSASVCRSVTMFSFLSLGRMLGQRTQLLNAILVSALMLLVIRPSWLLEAGFQLSYAAMFGIVAFYPIIRGLFKPKYSLLKWVWEAAAVSMAAQLFTAPLVIYYFHQFPLFSVFTSILAIPMLSLMIALFTCSVPLMFAGLFENSLNTLLVTLASLMNHTMEFLASLPGAMLEEIPLSLASLILWMVLLGLLVLALQGRSGLAPYLFCVVLSTWIFHDAFAHWTLQRSSRLLIGHFRGPAW